MSLISFVWAAFTSNFGIILSAKLLQMRAPYEIPKIATKMACSLRKAIQQTQSFRALFAINPIARFALFGQLRIDRANPFVLQKFVTKLTASGNIRTGNVLALNTVNNVVSVVLNSLKTAHLAGYLPKYMANKIKRPNAVEKPVQNISLS